MPASVKVTGANETARALDKIASDLTNMTAINQKIIGARLGGVRSLTPVSTGTLRGSWDVTATKDTGSIVSPMHYALPVEVGTRYIPPVGMVARTLEAEQSKMLKEYNAAILEIGKKRGFRIE